MSLLMDALKKAEKARQTEAEKIASNGKQPDSQVSGAPLHTPEEARSRGLEDQSAIAGEKPEATRLAAPKSPAEWSLTTGEADSPSVSELAGTKDSSLPETMVEDTSATLPSLKSAQTSVNDYFSNTRITPPVERIEDGGTLPSTKAVVSSVDNDYSGRLRTEDPAATAKDGALLGERPDADEASRQAAQNVFDAKTSAHMRRGRSWTLLAGLPLLLLVLAVGGYYYWLSLAPRSIVVAQKAPPERVASLVQSADSVEPPTLQPVAPESSEQVALSQTNTPLAEGTVPSEAELDLSSEPSTDAADVTERFAQTGEAPTSGDLSPTVSLQGGDATATPPEELTTGALTSEQMPSAVNSDATKDPSIGRAQASSGASAALRPQVPAAIEQIKISRQTTPNQVHPLLTRAYAAFQSGDDSVALDAYTKVLAREPSNRDAMLGLAAVAVRDERYVEASEWYLKLLTLNPTHALAQAALIDLQRNLDPAESETRLKLLLDRQPKAAYLYFSLGNVLASQSRWAEAETAYFSALRYEGFNPDYAFNLAVSLDHLGQRDAALTYYRRALEMSEQQPAEFEPATVWQRIHAMAESITAE